MDIKLVLIDPKPALCNAWRKHFDGLPNIEIIAGYFEELPEFDCMVSAANSFGLMDGGVDHNLINERKIHTIACPGLGTATGRVPYPEAARQMAVAYRYYIPPETEF